MKLFLFSLAIIVTTHSIGQSANNNTLKSNEPQRVWKQVMLDDHSNGTFGKPITTASYQQKLDSVELFYWDVPQGTYRKANNSTYTYHANGLKATSAYVWLNVLQTKITSGRKYQYDYDVDDNVSAQIYYLYDTTSGNWGLYAKWEFSYNSNNLQSYWEYFTWNTTSSQWEINYKVDYSYNTNSDLILRLGYQWDNANSQWVDDYKETHIYNMNDEKIQYEEYSFSIGTSSWIIDLKEEYEYNANGNQIEFINYSDNPANGQYSAYQKRESVYNSSGLLISDETFVWSVSMALWENSYRRGYTYNSYNDRVQIESEAYNWGTWENTQITDYTFDVTVPYTDLVLPSESYYQRQLLSYKMKQYLNNQWEEQYKNVYHYSDFNPTSINEIATNVLVAYPNPCNQRISFNLGQNSGEYVLEIFDSLGKKMSAQTISNNQEVLVNHLSTGMYFYTIQHNGNQGFRGKIIKN